MNCETALNLIDPYLDASLAEQEKAELQAHFDVCSSCRVQMDRARTVLRLLRAAPIEPPSAGFEERVFTKVREHGDTSRRSRWFAAGFSSALAASLALWFISVPLLTKIDQSEALPMVTLEVSQIKTVSLAFNAPREFSQVTLTIELPDHFELDGYANEKLISWDTTLIPGKNVLSLPVIATAARNGVLVARLTSGEKTKTFSIRLVADGDRAGMAVTQIHV